MHKFQNKYRIPSARLQNWDYGGNASYFITVCTLGRECYFGDVVNGEMVLSEIGKIVATEWIKTPEIRPDMNLELGEYVVMPNHFHAIITIGENKFNTKYKSGENPNGKIHDETCDTTHNGTRRRDAMHCVSTPPPQISPQSDIPKNQSKNKFGPQSKNLASIIRGFKSGVTKNAHQIHAGFEWQTRFYDRIIRDDQAFQTISEYIINNPEKWDEDKFNPRNPNAE